MTRYATKPDLLDRAPTGRFWQPLDDGRILCTLCPRYCKLKDGQAGFCAIRANHGGELKALGYGRPTAMQIDPIEKKPLSHFLPGTDVFSLGTAGCNLGCKFCQNWDISKAKADNDRARSLDPASIVELAKAHECRSIATTYNEPTIWAEYVIDIAEAAAAQGLPTVAVTNGYITEEAFDAFYTPLAAANVDLKAFTEAFYSKVTLAHLEPVRRALVRLIHDTDVWVEITTLLIPGHNDGTAELRELASWVLNELGPDVPIHFTAFHPDYKMRDVERTPKSTLQKAREIGMETGLHFVYTGNVFDQDGGTTFCPGCGTALIVRDWHRITLQRLGADGLCPDCGTAIAGRWQWPGKD